MSLKAFAEKHDASPSSVMRKGKAHIVVAHYADGPRVTDHPSKKSAYEHGMSLRRQGIEAFSYSKAFAEQFKLDPRDQPRDEQGRFAAK